MIFSPGAEQLIACGDECRAMRLKVVRAIRDIRRCAPGTWTEGFQCGRASALLNEARAADSINYLQFHILHEFIFNGRGHAQRVAEIPDGGELR